MAAATTTAPFSSPSVSGTTHRIAAIDIVRGIVMILMAIDHVRVFSGLPAGGPTAGIFLTRWITHFVAPAFVFLAGTGAFLHKRRMPGRQDFARFLLTRGLWLVLLELTIIRFAWTFNFDFGNYLLAGVLWAIGWSMIGLAALSYLPPVAVGAFGLAVIFGHNLIDFFPDREWLGQLGQILYFNGDIPPLIILYTLIPWIGVMATGYAFGMVMTMRADRRRTFCLGLGAAAIALFLALRLVDVYGDPRSWHDAEPAAVWIRFLNTTKYPASLLFPLMTLGPMLLALTLFEKARGRVVSVLATFGRVPLFYYLLHIPVIHLAAVLVSLLRNGNVDPWLFANHPVLAPDPPYDYIWSLPLLYLVTAAVVALLYFPCRWFARLKDQRRGDRRLSYL
jgi:uncharacterized membrane protein